MTADLTPSDRAAIANIVSTLEAGWNGMDGAALAAPFSEDADFVNIRADHFRGRAAIAEGHEEIFRTIYAGSTNHYTLETARMLRPNVALAHVHALLDVPQGPMKGRQGARFSMVLAKGPDGWEIASFYNTLEAVARTKTPGEMGIPSVSRDPDA